MTDYTQFIRQRPPGSGVTGVDGQAYQQPNYAMYQGMGVSSVREGSVTLAQRVGGPFQFAGLAVADFLNTVSSSVGLTDEKLLEQQLQQRMPDSYKYYMDNKGAIQFTSSVVGAFVPSTLAIKGINAMSKAGQLLSKIPYASRLLVNEQKAVRIQEALKARSSYLALQGERGAGLVLDTELKKLRMDRMIYGVEKGLKETVAAEAAIYGTMNSSDVLFPEEWEYYDYLPIMGAGALLGVGLETVIARKVSSELIRKSGQLAGVALDPHNIVGSGFTVRAGSEDAGITLYSLNSRDLDAQIAARGEKATSRYAENVQRQKTANSGAIVGSKTKDGLADKIAYRGSKLSPRTQLTDGQATNIKLALNESPFAMLGVKEISPYDPETVTRALLDKNKQDYIEELEKQAAKDETRANSKKVSKAEKAHLLENAQKLRLKKTTVEQNYQPFVLRNGQWLPMEDHFLLFTDFKKNRQLFEASVPFDLKGRKLQNHFDPLTRQEFSFGIDYSLDYAGTKGKNLASLHEASIYEQSAVFAGFDAVLEGIKGIRIDRADKMPRIQVSLADNWRRLDAIDEGIRRGHIRPEDITFAKGSDLNKMRMEVVNQKFKEYVAYRKKIAVPAKYVKTKKPPMNDAAIRYALNMPSSQNGDVSELEQLFHGLYITGKEDLQGMSLQELVSQTVKLRHWDDPNLEFAQQTLDELKAEDYNSLLRGNSFGPPDKVRKAGQYLEPVLAWRQNLTADSYKLQTINNDLMLRRGEVKGALLGDNYDPKLKRRVAAADTLSGKLAANLDTNPAAKVATGIDEINQASLRGEATFTTSRFASRDDPIMQAAHEINTITDRIKNRHIIDTLNTVGSHGKSYELTFNTLRTKENEAHLFQFGEYLRARQGGWYLEKQTFKNPDGTHSFVLDVTKEFNQKRFRALFDKELTKGTLMPRITTDAGAYQALQISPQAYEAALSMRELGERLLADQNRIRAGMGQSLINQKNWWAPPRVFSNKHIAYIVNRTDEGTIKRIIVGDTEADLAAKKASSEVQEYIKSVDGVVYNQDEMVTRLGESGFHSKRDEIFFELLDAGDHVVKGTKASRGSSVDPFTNSGRELLDESVEALNRQWENVARDTVQLWFEPQIAYAQRADFVSPAPKGKLSPWAYYKDTLVGNRLLRRDTTIGKFYTFVEDHADRALERYWDATKGRGISGLVSGTVQKKLADVGFAPATKRFERLKQELGDWLPYETTQQWLESNFNISPPKGAKQFAAQLNGLTSALTLRMFEFAHPILNLSGVIATSPAVINALKMRADEDLAGWSARTSAYGSIVPSKKPFSFFNSVKLMTKAATYGFKPQGRLELEYAKKFGYLDQQVAELNNILVKPLRSEGDWRDFASRAVDVVSTLSDKSEVMSRGWAHMAGVLLAKEHGIVDQKMAHTFAHRFANEIIGDYRSSNRPTVFQGALGMPLGLFQTYIWNYYQRIFSYIENRQYKALATQYAMQASLYGTSTMPGFDVFNSLWNSADQSRGNPVDEIQSRFGPATADLLLYGTLSNIPKIFGGDGIALYSRGDANPRVPTFIDPSTAPIVQLANNFYQMLASVGDQLMGPGGLSAQQTSEAFSQYFINRPMARVMELFAGYSTDRNGNVLADDIYSATSIIARTMGMRTLQEAKTMEVMRRQKLTEIDQYATRARLREAIKSATRGGDINESLLQGAFEDYALSGGDPTQFSRFLKTTIMAATTPKGQKKLEELLNSNTRISDAMRLLNAGVLVDERDVQGE